MWCHQNIGVYSLGEVGVYDGNSVGNRCCMDVVPISYGGKCCTIHGRMYTNTIHILYSVQCTVYIKLDLKYSFYSYVNINLGEQLCIADTTFENRFKIVLIQG